MLGCRSSNTGTTGFRGCLIVILILILILILVLILRIEVRWMAVIARVARACLHRIAWRAAERSVADSIRSVSEVEEVVCVCEGNRGYLRRLRPKVSAPL